MIAYCHPGHKEEGEHEVVGYEGAGEFQLPINYGKGTEVLSLDFVSKLVDISEECEQYLSWKCLDASIHTPNQDPLEDPYTLDSLITYWRNRTGGIATYFAGGDSGSYKCACGADNSCDDPANYCNCDSNDDVLREDDGFITNKNDLPVTMFCAGDTGEY